MDFQLINYLSFNRINFTSLNYHTIRDLINLSSLYSLNYDFLPDFRAYNKWIVQNAAPKFCVGFSAFAIAAALIVTERVAL